MQKFVQLSTPYTTTSLRNHIIDTIANLDAIPVADLTRLLIQVQIPQTKADHKGDRAYG